MDHRSRRRSARDGLDVGGRVGQELDDESREQPEPSEVLRKVQRPAASFSYADIGRYYHAQMALRGTCEALAAAYAVLRFENGIAREFAREDFPRGLGLMEQCIHGAIEAFPPRISSAPDTFAILDATIKVCVHTIVRVAHRWDLRRLDGRSQDAPRSAYVRVQGHPI